MSRGAEAEGPDAGIEPVSVLLPALLERSTGERIPVGEIADGMEGRSNGLVLFALALPETIPMVGLSAILAAPIFFLGGAMAVYGRDVPLPGWIRRRTLRRGLLEKTVRKTLPAVRRLERVSRPRWDRLAGAVRLQGAVCAAMAVVLAVPMPGINILAAFAVAGTGLGILQRDGAVVAGALGFALLTAAAIAALVTGVVALAG